MRRGFGGVEGSGDHTVSIKKRQEVDLNLPVGWKNLQSSNFDCFTILRAHISNYRKVLRCIRRVESHQLSAIYKKQSDRSMGTRATIRGDCEVQFRCTFSQNLLSIQGC